MKLLIEEAFEELPVYIKPNNIINLGFQKTAVYNWFNSNDFPVIRNGRSVLAQKDKLKEWMKERELL